MKYLFIAICLIAISNSFCQLSNTKDAQIILLASKGRPWELWFNGGRIVLGDDDTNLIGLWGKCSLLNGIVDRIDKSGVWKLTSITFVYFEDSYWGWPVICLTSITKNRGMLPFRIANVNSHTYTLMSLYEYTERQYRILFRALDVGLYSDISNVTFASKIASKP